MEHSFSKKLILGIQHVLAMFGATVLVPTLTGLNTSITLLCAGLGTLLFHAVTKRKVPVFLGSSFAFMGAIQTVLVIDPSTNLPTLDSLAKMKGGLIIAGILYVIIALLIRIVGYNKVNRFLPAIVTGPMIIVIGLRLSSTAISTAFYDANTGAFVPIYMFIAFCVVATIVIISVYTKGFFNLMPILFALIVGYILSAMFNILNLDSIQQVPFFSFSSKTIREQLTVLPQFDLSAILAIAPISLVTIIEHVGDITTNGAVVGKNFIEDPGIHKTLLGDGLATAMAGFLGGPANTTYGENTGVLAVTKNYDPAIIRIAACVAIVLGIFGKLGAFISCIPGPVKGGISIVLFGMIASVGVRILINNKLDLSNSRNLMISSLIFVLGIGIQSIPITNTVEISGLAIAAFVGIILAFILPESNVTNES